MLFMLSAAAVCCQMLQSFRGSSSIREGGRSLHLTIFLRHSHWYYSHAIVPLPTQRIMVLITAWLYKNLLLREKYCHLWARSSMQPKLYIVGDPLSISCMQLQQVKHLDFYTGLNKDFRLDLFWWHIFMISWNGFSMLRSGLEKLDFCVQTDTSGSWGCVAYFNGRWFQLPWDQFWQDANIMAK